tara:strand:- start:467 stop:619 length:153 start_codon:yes stop_codon:yes gene_type:complete
MKKGYIRLTIGYNQIIPAFYRKQECLIELKRSGENYDFEVSGEVPKRAIW